jgi:integrase
VNPAARPAGTRKHPAGLPKVDRHDAVYLTQVERDVILRHCHPTIRNMMIVGLGTGMRIGELIGLQVKHVHLVGAGGTVHVRRTSKRGKRFGPPKSAAGRRDITVGLRGCQALREQVDGKGPEDFVFMAARGGPCHESTVRKLYWKKALAAAQRCTEHPPPPAVTSRGVQRLHRDDEVSTCACPHRLHRLPRIHDWRHSHASDLIAAGWSAKKIQVRLGHSNYQLTMNTYGHLFNTGDDGELAALDMLALPEPASRARRALAGSVRRRVVRRSAAVRR